MRLLVYEFVTGGGCFSWPRLGAPGGSLLAEGAAMLGSLAADLTAAGHQVETLRDVRLTSLEPPAAARCAAVATLEDERRLLCQLASSADGVVLIVPETDGALQRRAQWVLDAGGRLMSPGPGWISLAADKARCCQRLQRAGVPTAPACDRLSEPHSGPLISKPRDGCGSQDLRIVTREQAGRELRRGRHVEQLVGGWPVSVAVLCGPAGDVALTPCEQHLGPDFAYLGGRTLADSPLADRARELALRAVAALGPCVGYVGVDLILADGPRSPSDAAPASPPSSAGPDSWPADDVRHPARPVPGQPAAPGLAPAGAAAEDVVIEINPRLTTSYVGLSRQSGGEAARAMIDVALGRPARWQPSRLDVRFTAAGRCEVGSGG